MTKVAGYKAVLKRNTTGTTYVNIGQLLEIGDIGSTRARLDATAHGDEWMDFVSSVQEGNEVTIRYAFDPADAQQVALKSDYDNNVTKKFRMEHPGYPTRGIEFTAISSGYLERVPIDGIYEAEVTLKIVNPGVTTYVP